MHGLMYHMRLSAFNCMAPLWILVLTFLGFVICMGIHNTITIACQYPPRKFIPRAIENILILSVFSGIFFLVLVTGLP